MSGGAESGRLPETTNRGAPRSGLERRSAALIAYLALEGPSSRSRLAGLLWPDTPESTARNNLSQTLRRLRQSETAWQPSGDDLLTLAAGPDADAALRLLRPHDYDDLPDFADWLLAVQERRRATRTAEVRAEVARREADEELRAALDATELWLDLDPISEQAYRAQMRLHHLLGDRAGALAAYHRCQAALRRELGLDPSPETVALAREVQRSAVPVQVRPALPLSVRRPPRLIGRAAEWRAMERAWAEGKGIILSGEPGVGKTRLLRDFMAAHGQNVIFQGRPGDRLVPYSTHARSYAAVLRQFAGLALQGWVRRELARIVPSLGEAPPPITSDAEKLRFYQAKTEVLQLAAAAGMGALAFDDLQFVDAASVEAGEHSLASFWGDEHTSLRTIHAYRAGELTAELEARIDALVSAGQAVRVRLSPLSAQEVDELLGSLDLPEVYAQSAGIALASGGNPLVVLETARNLLGSDGVARAPQRLGELLAERLERLSPAAVSLARAAAVLGTDTSPEAAAHMLDGAPLELAGPWRELESAQVLSGSAFTHDLLQEAVLQRLPAPLRALLHRRAAAALEPAGQAPARIAEHWIAGEEPDLAVTWWLRAGDDAKERYRHQEAAELYERAWQTSGQHELRFQAGLRLAKLLGEGEGELSERLQMVVSRLRTQARTPTEHAAALTAECQLLALRGEGTALEEAARQGLTWSRQDLGHPYEVDLMSYLGSSLFFQHRLDAALSVIRETAQLADQTGNFDEWCIALNNESSVLSYLGRRTEASAPLRLAEQRLAGAGRYEQQADVLLNLGNLDLGSGRVVAAHRSFERAQHLLSQVDGAVQDKLVCLHHRQRCARLREQYAEALALNQQGLDTSHDSSFLRPMFLQARAQLLVLLGAHDQARDCLTRLQASGRLPDVGRFQVSLISAQLAVEQGHDVVTLLEGLAAEAREQNVPLTDRLALALAFSPLLTPEGGIALIQKLPEEAWQAELFGYALALLIRRAQAHLALGRLDEAEAALREVSQADPELSPACPRAELLFTQARLLERRGDPFAPSALQAARAELLRVADTQVPPEYRAAFLALPLHAELLAGSPEGAAWRPLTDLQWQRLEPLLSAADQRTGRPRTGTRAALDGVLWALSTGAAWNRPFPAQLPSAATCYRRYREWQQSGALQAALTALGGPLAARVLARLS